MMAESADSVATVLGEVGRDDLECSICHERYDTPKILNCLHSFCEKCLLTYRETLRDPSQIPCPVCRQSSKLPSDGIPGLKTNFQLMEIVGDGPSESDDTQPGDDSVELKDAALKVFCELCEDQREAQSRCMDCPFFLCKQCQGGHRRIAATANHNVLPLNVLQLDVANMQQQVKIQPPCEKHEGEKKCFYCQTCKQLICRECTVVDHRAHTFTSIESAASRGRQKTKELIQSLQMHMSTFKKTKSELKKIAITLDHTVSLAKKNVIKQASLKESSILQNESDIIQGISRRENARKKSLQELERGSTLSQQTDDSPFAAVSSHLGYTQMLPTFQMKYTPAYVRSTDQTFSEIDDTFTAWKESVEKMVKTDKHFNKLIDNLRNETRQNTASDQHKVKSSKEQLLAKIKVIYNQRKNYITLLEKHTDSQLQRMYGTFKSASGLESASNIDFLDRHVTTDVDICALLEESPLKLHCGYSNIQLKRCNGTDLGEVVTGATWTFTREIVPRDSLNDLKCRFNPKQRNASRPISMDAFKTDEILVGCKEGGGVSVYKTGGRPSEMTRSMESEYKADKVVTFPDGSFITVTLADRWVNVFQPYTASSSAAFQLPCTEDGNPVSVAHHKDKHIVFGFTPLILMEDRFGMPKKIGISGGFLIVYDFSNSSVISRLNVSVKPTFLACTTKGRILVGERNVILVLDIEGVSSLTIHPIIDGRHMICAGLCYDSHDNIFVAGSDKHCHSKVHVHQYSPHGYFIGCSIIDIQLPISGIAVTGKDTLVVAEKEKLKLFKMT